MASFTFAGTAAVVNALNLGINNWRVLGERIVAESKATCPPGQQGKKGPHLRDNLHLEILASGVGPRIVISSPLPQLAYVIQGTQPHLIQSHGSWSLHNAVTDEYFGPVVNHPGNKRNPFVLNAARRVIQSTGRGLV